MANEATVPSLRSAVQLSLASHEGSERADERPTSFLASDRSHPDVCGVLAASSLLNRDMAGVSNASRARVACCICGAARRFEAAGRRHHLHLD